MGEGRNGNSWFTALKRAFTPPHSHKKTERKTWVSRETESNLTEAYLVPGNQHHVIAVAAASKATIEILRIKRQIHAAKQHSAANLIQTAFRAYRARRALVALRGIVALQAIIRGQNIRKQTKTTMKYMQALLRVQAQVRDQRNRLFHDSRARPVGGEPAHVLESKNIRDIKHRKSRSRDRSFSSVPDDWRVCPHTLEAILKERNEAASAQRASTSYKRETIKTAEIDSLKRSLFSTIDGRRSHSQRPIHRQPIITQRPKTPQPRAASPCHLKEEKSNSAANTPSRRIKGNVLHHNISTSTEATMPNYMAATESAKARIRSQSMPRQGPSTADRERGGSAKKHQPNSRCNAIGQKLRSSSFKSIQASHMRMEEQTTISPCSTMDLRRFR